MAENNGGMLERRLDSGPDIERTMFFSDAVFAIAMTLLAVDIKAPDVPAGQLGQAILDQRPEFFAYALSFAVAGAYWLSHHRLFRLLKGFTGGLQRLNLLLLFFVALLAYATDMLALHDDTSLGVVVYALALGLIGSVNTLMWSYCRRHGLFRDDVNRPAPIRPRSGTDHTGRLPPFDPHCIGEPIRGGVLLAVHPGNQSGTAAGRQPTAQSGRRPVTPPIR